MWDSLLHNEFLRVEIFYKNIRLTTIKFVLGIFNLFDLHIIYFMKKLKMRHIIVVKDFKRKKSFASIYYNKFDFSSYFFIGITHVVDNPKNY